MDRRKRSRLGTATVELAICLPVLTAIVFGTIEACGMLYTTQSLEIAGYEGVRMAIRQDAYDRVTGQPNEMTNGQVEAHVNRVLLERQIVGGVVDITPGDIRAANPGDVLTVRVTAPALANSLLPAWFWGNVNISAMASMVKE